MKKRINIWTAFLIGLLFFSFISGCNLIHKLTTKSKVTNDSAIIQDIKSTTKSADSIAVLKIDTSKSTIKTKEKSSSKKVTEVTIELDSNINQDVDTTGNSPMDKLINAALKRAKSIRMRVEEEQHKESQKEESINNHKSESTYSGKKEESNLNSSTNNRQKSTSKDVQRDVKKDSTIKANLNGWWFLIIIPVLIIGFLIYKRFK
ncbi:hypothetical protein DBR40_24700 [Pedobacter sp. KBW01]|uniref:hypothetical protein n=1 Tax=Pedobacter sp. KBW01 TaxID=2153364 RepID=UPI000F5936E8|nr:hypothetical protein [Pedobacter sp. KBW01]RQO65076.1 hypothetical protein DBR40_24700 [Pedobacter sp. KBW01]